MKELIVIVVVAVVVGVASGGVHGGDSRNCILFAEERGARVTLVVVGEARQGHVGDVIGIALNVAAQIAGASNAVAVVGEGKRVVVDGLGTTACPLCFAGVALAA